MGGSLRNTIIASVLGGMALVGLCLGLTGGTMSAMKDQAAEMASSIAEARVEEAASSASSSEQPQDSVSSEASSSASNSMSSDADGLVDNSMSSEAAAVDSSGDMAAVSSSGADSSSDNGLASSAVSEPKNAHELGDEGTGQDVQVYDVEGNAVDVGVGAGPQDAPQTQPSIVSGTSGGVHIVRWGDTLAHLSAEYGRSVDEFVNLNGLNDPNLIYAESALRVPQG